MSALLTINGLKKRSGSFELGPIDLTLESGLVVALVGPNGAGKSTMFRLLTNLIHPDEGGLQWFRGAVFASDELEIKRKVGYVPEQFEPLDDSMTVSEWMRFLSRWYPSWDERKCKFSLEKYKIDTNKKLKELSKGMQRKVSFIHAISANPEVLLLDEPSSGLDPFAWRAMMDDIREFMEHGERTVFFATHVMDEVRRLSDCIAFLNQGRLLGFFEKDRLIDEWKTFWVEMDPEEARHVPGVVNVTRGEGQSVRVVSSLAKVTEQALKQAGLRIVSIGAVELDDILWHLMQNQNR